nr:histidine kinase [Deinococcus aestuarii]
MRLVGVCTFVAVTAHAVLALPAKPWRLTPEEVGPWALSLAGFLLVLVWATSRRVDRRGSPWSLGLIVAQTGLALTANHIFNGNSLLSGLLLVVAAQVGLRLALPLALGWVTVQTLGLGAVLLYHWPPLDAWPYTTGYLCFQLFAVGSAQLAVREVRARQRLAQVVAELRETRTLLNEASRNAERLHIARELHDLLGHHLTALNMNLEVTAHLVPDPAARLHLGRAQTVARQLLGDVREAVSSLRGTAQGDFQGEVARLARTTPALAVHLQFSDDFSAPGPLQAHVLLRCVQEVLTNTVRHAHARQVWLTFTRTPDHLDFQASDDGRGTRHLHSGCGLSGMRERLESVGGALRVEGRPGQGLALFVSVPLTLPVSGGAR